MCEGECVCEREREKECMVSSGSSRSSKRDSK